MIHVESEKRGLKSQPTEEKSTSHFYDNVLLYRTGHTHTHTHTGAFCRISAFCGYVCVVCMVKMKKENQHNDIIIIIYDMHAFAHKVK